MPNIGQEGIGEGDADVADANVILQLQVDGETFFEVCLSLNVPLGGWRPSVSGVGDAGDDYMRKRVVVFLTWSRVKCKRVLLCPGVFVRASLFPYQAT